MQLNACSGLAPTKMKALPSFVKTISRLISIFTSARHRQINSVLITSDDNLGGTFWGDFGTGFLSDPAWQVWMARLILKLLTDAFGWRHFDQTRTPSRLNEFVTQKVLQTHLAGQTHLNRSTGIPIITIGDMDFHDTDDIDELLCNIERAKTRKMKRTRSENMATGSIVGLSSRPPQTELIHDLSPAQREGRVGGRWGHQELCSRLATNVLHQT